MGCFMIIFAFCIRFSVIVCFTFKERTEARVFCLGLDLMFDLMTSHDYIQSLIRLVLVLMVRLDFQFFVIIGGIVDLMFAVKFMISPRDSFSFGFRNISMFIVMLCFSVRVSIGLNQSLCLVTGVSLTGVILCLRIVLVLRWIHHGLAKLFM